VLGAALTSGQPSLFTSAHASAANNIDTANQGISNGQFIEDTVEPISESVSELFYLHKLVYVNVLIDGYATVIIIDYTGFAVRRLRAPYS